MALTPISAGDTGASVRAKINSGFSAADAAADAAAAAAAAAASKASLADIANGGERPGDNPALFANLTAGLPEVLSGLPSGNVVTVSGRGRSYRVTGEAVVAAKRMTRIENARKYAIRAGVRRAVDSGDPAGDAVVLAVQMLAADGTAAGAPAALATLSDLTVASGARVVEVVVSTVAGPGVDVVLPAGVYARVYWHAYGSACQTDIEFIGIPVDVTDALAAAADVPVAVASNVGRPGDRPDLFTTALIGRPSDLSPLSAAGVVTVPGIGRVYRPAVAGFLATLAMYRIEPGRRYRVRGVLRRHANVAGATLDSVAFGVQLMDAAGGEIPRVQLAGFSGLAVGQRVIADVVVSTVAGEGVDVVLSSSTVYVRPWWWVSDVTCTSDIESIEPILDVTDWGVLTPDVTGLTSRVGGIESQQAVVLENVALAQAVAEEAREAAQGAAATPGVSYDTLSGLTAAAAGLDDGTVGNVIADGLNNGYYVIESGVPVRKSTATVPGLDTRLSGYQADTTGRFSSLADNAMDLVNYNGSDYWAPFVDSANNLVFGVSLSTGNPEGSAVDRIVTPTRWNTAAQTAVGDSLESLQAYTGDDAYPIIPCLNGAILAYRFDTNKYFGHLYDAVLEDARSSASTSNARWVTTTALTPVARANRWLHVISYGQSLSVGAEGQPPLSTSQPYSNKTFSGGVKSAVGTGTSTAMALVEDSLGEGGATGTNRGETPCSGAANWCAQLAAVEAGIDPSTLVLFASAPGQGGTRIDELSKGTAPYIRLLGHVTAAKALATAAGAGYAVLVIYVAQGESDCDGGTSRSLYTSRWNQCIGDLNTDIKAITGQSEDVRFLFYQTAYKAVASGGAIALAQRDLAESNPLVDLVAPIHHLTYTSGGLHLTNASYLRLGRAFGRAIKQVLIDQRRPDCIRPVSATARGTTLTIQFRSPNPLKLDTDMLAATTNYGFKVIDDTGTLTLSNIVASGWTVTMTLNRSLGSNPKARYGLDYLGSGLKIVSGASVNLRDSTPDTFKISGVTYPAWHVAAAFELPIINLDATS